LKGKTNIAERNFVLALCLFPEGVTEFEMEKLVNSNPDWFGNYAELPIFKEETEE
jgi:hypothetical protein